LAKCQTLQLAASRRVANETTALIVIIQDTSYRDASVVRDSVGIIQKTIIRDRTNYHVFVSQKYKDNTVQKSA
jgi:hypothetical protein